MRRERTGLRPALQFIRGIFAGGTFCHQAQQVLRPMPEALAALLRDGPIAINVGVRDFAESLNAQGVEVEAPRPRG